MKYFYAFLVCLVSLNAKCQLSLNFSAWSDSITLSSWKSSNFEREDTVDYNGYKLYSLNHAYFASLRTNSSKQGFVTGTFPVNFRPAQLILTAAFRSNVPNSFYVYLRFKEGTDTIGYKAFVSPQGSMHPDLDHSNKVVNWQQYIISIDSSDIYAGHTPDSVFIDIHSLIYSGSMNDTADIWLDELTFLDHHTAIKETPGVSRLQIYPNPTAGESILSFNSPASFEGRLGICNVQGVKVHELNDIHVMSGINQLQLQLGSLPSGLYFCEFITPQGTKVIKVQVLH